MGVFDLVATITILAAAAFWAVRRVWRSARGAGDAPGCATGCHGAESGCGGCPMAGAVEPREPEPVAGEKDRSTES